MTPIDPTRSNFSDLNSERLSHQHIQDIVRCLEDLGSLQSSLSAEQVLQIGKEFALLARSFFSEDFRDIQARNTELVVEDHTVHDDTQTEKRRKLYKEHTYSASAEIVSFFDTVYESFDALEVVFLQQAKVGVQYPSIADFRSIVQAALTRSALALATGVPHNQMQSVEFDKMHKEWISLRKDLQSRYEKLWAHREKDLEKSFRRKVQEIKDEQDIIMSLLPESARKTSKAISQRNKLGYQFRQRQNSYRKHKRFDRTPPTGKT